MSNSKDKQDVSTALEDSVGVYIGRFKAALGEMRLYENLFFHVDIPKLMEGTPEGAKEQVFTALQNLIDTKGYYIYKTSITFVWAEAEAFMHDFLKSWLTHVVSPANVEIFGTIKINEYVRAYERLSDEAVVDLYVKLLKEKLRRGGDGEAKVFFKALDVLGLEAVEGQDERALVQSLTEMQQLRNVLVHRGGIVNVLVHRGGIVDEAILKACPWLDFNPSIELGRRFPLNSENATDYSVYPLDLVSHVLKRVERYQLS